MKAKLLFTLFLFTAYCSAQIVNIPDVNFKSKLLAANSTNFYATTNPAIYSAFYNNWSGLGSHAVDTNGDGEIQVSEAQAIKCLDLKNSNISDLTGISSFTNLESLRINGNILTALDVSQNTALLNLRCEFNNLTTINLSNCTTLLDFDCSNNQLLNLDVTPCTSLQKMYCTNNSLTSLIITQSPALQILHCYYNNITSLDASQCNGLLNLQCNINELTSLNLAGCSALQMLQCYNNNLTTLALTDCSSLTYLRCELNQLTTLDFTPSVDLEYVDCHSNQLTTLNLSQSTSLLQLRCNDNNLISLDVSQCIAMNKLHCNNNEQLTTLNLKNGIPEWIDLYIQYNSNLEYICADEEDIEYLQLLIDSYNFSNCHVNSYCTFTPGGTYYKITGNTLLDYTNDGCDSNDFIYKNLNFTISNNENQSVFIANESGNYFIPVGTGVFTITPNLENPSYFNINPPNFTVDFPAEVSPFTQNFCVTANGLHSDVEIVILPINAARPGFDAKYEIIYKNKGNQVENGTISFTYNGTVLDLMIVNPIYDNETSNTFTWNYTNLQPFETRLIEVKFNVNAPTDIPAVEIDDILDYSATITTLNTDETPNDNIFLLNQVVVGSFDPNDKTCLEGKTIVPSSVGEYVHYLIRFENTGTYPAENIVVKDMIDVDKFDVNSLVPIGSSHDFVTRINGNKVEFLFEGIQLPFDDANNDGYVVFKIKTKSSLVFGDIFSNAASIYFDYNFPIETNNYSTIIQNALGLNENEYAKTMVLYPNPVLDFLHFSTNEQVLKVAIYDLNGRILQSVSVHENKVDLNALKTGNYFVKIYTEKGIVNRIIIKK